MEWYEAEVQALEQSIQEHPPAGSPVVFYGSSSIRLWASLAEDFPALELRNLGFGGSTLAACVHFFPRLVPPCRPRALVFYAGDNDLGDGRSAQQVVQSFVQLLSSVDQTLGSIPFAYISIKPSPARWPIIERIQAVNLAIKALLATRAASEYVDVFTPMLSQAHTPRPELFSEDGLHLNPAGYRLWAEVLRRHTNIIF